MLALNLFIYDHRVVLARIVLVHVCVRMCVRVVLCVASVLCCAVIVCSVLHCIRLYRRVLDRIALYRAVMHYTVCGWEGCIASCNVVWCGVVSGCIVL